MMKEAAAAAAAEQRQWQLEVLLVGATGWTWRGVRQRPLRLNAGRAARTERERFCSRRTSERGEQLLSFGVPLPLMRATPDTVGGWGGERHQVYPRREPCRGGGPFGKSRTQYMSRVYRTELQPWPELKKSKAYCKWPSVKYLKVESFRPSSGQATRNMWPRIATPIYAPLFLGKSSPGAKHTNPKFNETSKTTAID